MNEDIKCNHCGCQQLYKRETYSGECNLHFDFSKEDVLDTDNGEMYSSAIHKDKSKYLYCGDCYKRTNIKCDILYNYRT